MFWLHPFSFFYPIEQSIVSTLHIPTVRSVRYLCVYNEGQLTTVFPMCYFEGLLCFFKSVDRLSLVLKKLTFIVQCFLFCLSSCLSSFTWGGSLCTCYPLPAMFLQFSCQQSLRFTYQGQLVYRGNSCWSIPFIVICLLFTFAHWLIR